MTSPSPTLQDHVAEGWVSYGDFGAAGDGVTDDMAAIAATHAYANDHRLQVRADDDATYYIGGRAGAAIIQTSTDFGRARFVIDDTQVEDRQAAVFEVRSRLEPYQVRLDGLRRGQQKLPITLPTAAVVVATNDRIKHFIRFGANQNDGAPQKDVFLVGADGEVDPHNPIIWDFDHITTLDVVPIDAEELRISGGQFTTIANQAESKYTYYGRNIVVRRSNVTIEGLSHDITGERDHGAPYRGMIVVSRCAHVTVKDCRLTGHTTYETIGAAGRPVRMGSYDLSVEESLNVSFIDCIQTNDINDPTYWGIFASNYSKNLVLDGCTFSRFDAHRGVLNVTIRHCELGHMGIHAIGEGTVLVENTRVYGRYLIQLRPDYGSTWQGDIVIRNCYFQPRAGLESRAVLVEGSYSGHHDFGYRCHMPERITIENLEIDDAHHPAGDAGPVVLADFTPERTDDSYVEQFPYELTKQVSWSNVTTTSGRELRLSDNPYMFKDVVLTC